MTHLGEEPTAASATTAAPARRRRRTVIAIVVVLALGTGAFFAFRPKDAATPKPSPDLVLGATTGPVSPTPVAPTPSVTSPTFGTAPTPVAPPTLAVASGPPTSVATYGPPGVLTVSTRMIDLGTSSGPRTFQVSNTGGQAISYTVASSVGWLTATPVTHVLNPHTSITITIRADHSHVAEGDATETLAVIWDRGTVPITIKVRTERPPMVSLPGLTPPCQVSVGVSDESGVATVQLTWSGPGGSGSAPMTRSGSTWTATATGFPAAGSVTFRATATDKRGNKATSQPLTTSIGPCP